MSQSIKWQEKKKKKNAYLYYRTYNLWQRKKNFEVGLSCIFYFVMNVLRSENDERDIQTLSWTC